MHLRTNVTIALVFIFNFAFSEAYELRVVTLKFTEVSKGNAIASAHRHEHSGAVLTSFQDRGTFSVANLNCSDAIKSAFVIICKTVNSANRSVFLWAVARSSARANGLVNLLSTVQNTFVFVGVSAKRTYRGEIFSFASANQRRVVGFEMLIVTRTVVG
jgi:hypothetical protein